MKSRFAATSSENVDPENTGYRRTAFVIAAWKKTTVVSNPRSS